MITTEGVVKRKGGGREGHVFQLQKRPFRYGNVLRAFRPAGSGAARLESATIRASDTSKNTIDSRIRLRYSSHLLRAWGSSRTGDT